MHKPAASRSSSAETYVLAFRYKAPAKIDPRILDVKHLFQGSIEPQKKVTLIRSNKLMTSLYIHMFICFTTVIVFIIKSIIIVF